MVEACYGKSLLWWRPGMGITCCGGGLTMGIACCGTGLLWEEPAVGSSLEEESDPIAARPYPVGGRKHLGN